MALNFAGVGYAFGGKDAGLLALQAKVVRGFKKIEESRTAADPSGFFDALQRTLDNVAPGGLGDVAQAQEQVSETTEKSMTTMGRFMDAARKVFTNARKNVKGAETGVSSLGDVMERLDQLVKQSRFQTFIESISLSKLNEIGRGIEEIGTQGLNLTAGLESEYTQMAKASRGLSVSLAGNLKDARKLERRWSNLAIALNTGVEGIAQADTAFQRAGVNIRDLGLSLKDYIKTAEAAGADPGDLARSISKMAGTWGMTGDQIQSVLDTVAAGGQYFGNTAGAIRSFSGILDSVNEEFLKLASASKGGVAGALKSVSSLSGVFLKLGNSEDEATQKSVQIFQQLMQARQGFQEMFTGLQSEAPKLFEELGIGFGDAGQALDMLQKSPVEFTKNMIEMVERMKSLGMEGTPQFARLQQVIAQDVPALRELIQAGGDVSKSLEGIGEATKDSQGAFKKFGKEAFTTGRTLDEQYDLIQKHFITRIRRQSKAGRRFVRDSRKAFASFGDSIEALAAGGGPMAAVIEKMVAMHKIGAKALLPEALQPMAAVLGSTIQEVTPLIGALGALGFRLTTLLNPIALVGAAVAGLAAVFAGSLTKKEKGKTVRVSIEEALDTTATKVGKWADKMSDRISAFADKLPGYIDNVISFLGKLYDKMPWGKIGKALEKIYNVVVDKAVELFSGFWGKVFGKSLGKGASPFEKLGAKIAAGIPKMVSKLGDLIVDHLATTWYNITKLWDRKGTSFLDKILGTFKALGPTAIGALLFEFKVFPIGRVLGAILGPAFKFAFSSAMSVGTKVFSEGLEFIQDASWTMGKRIYGMFRTMPGPGNILGNALGKLSGSLRAFAGRVTGFGQSVYSAIAQTTVAQRAAQLATSGWQSLTGVLSGVGAKIAGFAQTLGASFSGLVGRISQATPAFAKLTGSLVGKAGLVAAAGLAGWQIGRFIGSLKIGTKTIDEHVQDAFAWIADNNLIALMRKRDPEELLKKTGLAAMTKERKTMLLSQVIQSLDKLRKGETLTAKELGTLSSFKGETGAAMAELVARTKPGKFKVQEIGKLFGQAAKMEKERIARQFAAPKPVQEIAPKVGTVPEPAIMPVTADAVPAMKEIKEATNTPEWYDRRFEPLVKEMVKYLRLIASPPGKARPNIGLTHRTAMASTGAPL